MDELPCGPCKNKKEQLISQLVLTLIGLEGDLDTGVGKGATAV